MSEPPAPVVATPIANVSAATAAVSTPMSCAPAGFCDAARIARPSQVRVSSSQRSASTTIAVAQAYSRAVFTKIGPTLNDSLK
jgi:hypothetical protein